MNRTPLPSCAFRDGFCLLELLRAKASNSFHVMYITSLIFSSLEVLVAGDIEMDWLQTVANIMQIIGVIWVLFFGGKAVVDVLRNRGQKHTLKFNNATTTNILLALIFLVLISLRVFPVVTSSPLLAGKTTMTPDATHPPATINTLTPVVSQSSSSSLICNNTQGTTWRVITQVARCSNGALVMQQLAGSDFAEVNLVNVNGAAFDFSQFRAQVQVTFLSAIIPDTTAALYIQLSRPQNGSSGFLFEVFPNATWDIEHIRGGKSASGTGIEGDNQGALAIDKNNNFTTATLAIEVKNQQITYSINNILVGSPLVLDSPPGAFGLIVGRQHGPNPPSSQVQFSQFVLDIAKV